MSWLFFITLAALSWTLRMLGGGIEADPAGSALLALGCLIVGAVLAGRLASRFRLPLITGYLLIGMIMGPHALGLETVSDARLLHLFEELALGLIALTAGGELRLEMVRQRMRVLLSITAAHTVGILVTVGAATWLLLELLPVLGPISDRQQLAAAALLGVIAVAVSPASTVAVIAECRARGELTETVLGVSILKDLVMLLLFTWVNALAMSWVAGGRVGLEVLHGVGLEIGASLVIGCLLGLLLGAYLTGVGQHAELTVVLLALVSAELGQSSHLEHLLVSMAAGFAVRNLFPEVAAGFLAALEQSSAPVFAVFFALVGASLDLRVLAALWLPAMLFAGTRLGAIWLFTRAPASLAGAGRPVVRLAWMGFVAQAGLSLGLAARIQREMGELGAALATLIVAAVVLNQLSGPVLWARALERSGEARQATPRGRAA